MMGVAVNLKASIDPKGIVKAIKLQGVKLYQENLDLDIVVERPSISLEKILDKIKSGEMFSHLTTKENFQEISNVNDCESIFKESVLEKNHVNLWYKGEDSIFHSAIHFFKNKYYLECEPKSDFNLLVSKKEQELCCKMDLQRGLVFFSIEKPVLDYEKQRLKLAIPNKIWRVQRRDFFRLDISAEMNISGQFSYHEKRVLCQLINISGSGAAFLVEGQFYDFSLEEELSNISIFIEGREVMTDARIKWIQESVESERELRVGVQFTTINEKDQDTIDRFVLKHSLDYFKKYSPQAA